MAEWIKNWDDQVNIFDDIIMLNSITDNIPLKLRRQYQTIQEAKHLFEKQMKDEGEVSLKTMTCLKIIEEYEKKLEDSGDLLNWGLFLLLVKKIVISQSECTRHNVGIEQVKMLEEKGLAFSFDEFVFINLENRNIKEIFSVMNYDEERLVQYEKLKRQREQQKENQQQITEKNHLLSLNSLLESDFKDKELFLLRLEGKTLQEIGDEKGLTRQRIRQRLERLKRSIPDTVELTEFRSLFQEFKISEDIFVNVFNPDPKVHRFLQFMLKSGKKDIAREIVNGDYSEEAKEYVLNKLGQAKIGDKLGISTKEDALINILADNISLQSHINKDDLVYLYNEYVIDYPKLHIENSRSLYTIADRSKKIIKSLEKGYRYFEFTMTDEIFNTLIKIFEEIPSGAYHMGYVFDKNREYFNSINLYDAYELHNFLFKYELPIPRLVLRRNPEFSIGEGTKNEYIYLELLKFEGKSVEQFVNYLNERFYFQKASIRSYVNIEFGRYIRSGIIFIDRKEYSKEIEELKKILTLNIYTSTEFEKIIKDNISIQDISANLVFQLGYIDRGALVVRNDLLTSRNALITEILSKEMIDISGDIYKTSDGYSIIHELEKDLKIIKVGHNRYYNTEYLEDKEMILEIFTDFIRKVELKVEDNSYFSIISLVNSGFHHKLMELGFELVTLDRLIFTSEVFRPVSQNVPVLYYKGGKKSVADFLLDKLLTYGSLELEKFTEEINLTYGLNYDVEDIRYRFSKEDVYYSKKLDKVYIYEEDYVNEMNGNLS